MLGVTEVVGTGGGGAGGMERKKWKMVWTVSLGVTHVKCSKGRQNQRGRLTNAHDTTSVASCGWVECVSIGYGWEKHGFTWGPIRGKSKQQEKR